MKKSIMSVGAICLFICGISTTAHSVQYLDSAITYHVDGYPINITSDDFNGDGWADLATINNAASSVSVLLNNGDGTFGPRTNYSTSPSYNPYNLTTGDIDGNGTIDIVSGGNQGAKIFYGVGDGTFAAGVTYYFGHSVHDVALADIDKDGRLDLITGHSVGDSVWIHINDGDSTFTKHPVVTEDGPKSLEVGYLDGDTYIDILVGCNKGTVWNLKNDQAGSFVPAQVHLGSLDDAAQVAVTDLNGDNIGDFAVIHSTNDFLFTYMNNGDGTYTVGPGHILSDLPINVAFGDVNYDNHDDILVCIWTTEEIELYLNDGSNTFSKDTGYTVGASIPRGLTFADFDGDGYPDLASAAYNRDAAAVLMNRMSLILSVDDINTGGTLPNAFALEQNYPNPFNPETKIRFALPTASDVTVEVFNMLGQSVTVLVNERLDAGVKEVTWDGTNANGATVGSGMYFYRITTDDYVDSKKMLLLK